MAKVFISFLGTSDYLKCSYEYHKNIIKDVRFVQEATIRLKCRDWSKRDKIAIFTTRQAFKNNWKNHGQKDRNTGKNLERTGLEKRLSDLQYDFSIKQINIPDGKTETEIWEIFSIVFGEIGQDDEIIFDITHAFRSIPMLAVVIINYAKVMKDATLEGLYYGAMEALGNISKIEKMALEKRVVPIHDLSSFNQLMEWTNGIDQFLTSGNAKTVSLLAAKSANTILSRTNGKDRSQKTIINFAKNLDIFTKALSSCRGRDIPMNAEKLKNNLHACKKVKFNEPLNKPLKPLLEKINKQMEPFNKNIVTDGIQSARWCLEHNLVQQGYTILQEILISYFVHRIGEDPNDFKHQNKKRTIANQAVTILSKKLPEEQWKQPSIRNKSLTYKFIDLYKNNSALIKVYRNLSNLRNDINHCGFNNNPAREKTLEINLLDYIVEVEKNISIQ